MLRHVIEDSIIYSKTIGQKGVKAGGKSIHFWKALCTGLSKIPKSLSYVLHVKSYRGVSLKSHVSSLETYLLSHLLN